MVMGTGIVFCAQASQLYICTSVPQMEVLSTRMRTSSSRTSGTGTSSSQRPGSALLFTTAFIVFCTSTPKSLHPKSQLRRQALLFRLPCLAAFGMVETYARDVGTKSAESCHGPHHFSFPFREHDRALGGRAFYRVFRLRSRILGADQPFWFHRAVGVLRDARSQRAAQLQGHRHDLRRRHAL